MTNVDTSSLSSFASRVGNAMSSSLVAPGIAGESLTSLADDSLFLSFALELFELQFKHNQPYREFCLSRKCTPQSVGDWPSVPAMPTSAFKEMDVTSVEANQKTVIFESSGTTQKNSSRHIHSGESFALYRNSVIGWFPAHLLNRNDGKALRLICLIPPAAQAFQSSLAWMFEMITRKFKCDDFAHTGIVSASSGWRVDLAKTVEILEQSVIAEQPLMVLGTAITCLELLDHLMAIQKRLRLAAGSHVLETGGYKGRARVIPRRELHSLITEFLGVPAENIVGEYGMCELSAQAYDQGCFAQNTKSGGSAPGAPASIFRFPPWARVQIVSPETGRQVAEGETGLIQVFDLANVWSVMAIQTEDLGIRRGDGFELIGRAAMAEPRGCSLMSR